MLNQNEKENDNQETPDTLVNKSKKEIRAERKAAKKAEKQAKRTEKQAIKEEKKAAKTARKGKPNRNVSAQKPKSAAAAAAQPVMPKRKTKLTKQEEKQIRKRIAQLTGKKKMTVQRTIPYLTMGKNGICQLTANTYSRTIQFGNTNYQLASDNQQEELFAAYCDILNYFDETIHFQLTFENQIANVEALKSQMKIAPVGDEFDPVREEYTKILFHQLEQGTNGRQLFKYLTFSIESDSPGNAKIKLDNIANEIIRLFKAMDVEAHIMNGEQRLASMYRSLNPFDAQPFLFDWETLRRGGYTDKDFIAPTSMVLKRSAFEIGNVYGAVAGINIVGAEIPDRMLTDFMMEDNILAVNIHAKPYETMAAQKFVRSKLSDVQKSQVDEQKKASSSGYDINILPEQMKEYIADLQQLLADLNEKSERLFHTTLTIRYYAETPKKLKTLQDKLIRITQKNGGRLVKLDFMQEEAIGASLPLGVNKVPIDRCLTTSAIAGFMPFTTDELFISPKATYYGLNSRTRNMIMASRLQLDNPNGIFLGIPGKGKSFSAKREIFDVFLRRPDDDIFINDPEGEYAPLVELLHGQVIKISSGSGNFINPLDIPLDPALVNEELISDKSNFIISFCSLITGDTLQADETSMIDKCLRNVYGRFMTSTNPSKDTMPTLADLQNELRLQSGFAMSDGVGKRVADSMEMYVTGSHKFFNHRTTVDITNRLVCFDIRDMNAQLRDLAMLIIQNEVWTRVSSNRNKDKRTWYYCDEFHLMLRERHTAKYSVEIWKRFRKWGGIPSGITQNVKDLSNSVMAESILSNSEFVYLLSQSPEDRAILADSKHLSVEQQKCITNAPPGHGLLIYGGKVIPFEDKFPQDTQMYRIMDTKPKEQEPQIAAS